ncbi:uncharacterized protein LOC142340558 [Convolutriloba macropyga]|uniref:uncharacterized protein LOC142340558 n=1 Tax=Convolutriloba macropyga TaxID=536237 RepID=UPI003F51D9E9
MHTGFLCIVYFCNKYLRFPCNIGYYRLLMGRRTKNANPSPIRKGNAETATDSCPSSQSEPHMTLVTAPDTKVQPSFSNACEKRTYLPLTQVVPKVIYPSNNGGFHPKTNVQPVGVQFSTTMSPLVKHTSQQSNLMSPPNVNNFNLHTQSQPITLNAAMNAVSKFLPSLTDSKTIPGCVRLNENQWMNRGAGPRAEVTGALSMNGVSVGSVPSLIFQQPNRQPTKRRLELDTYEKCGSGAVMSTISTDLSLFKRRRDDVNENTSALPQSCVASKIPPSVMNCSLQLQTVSADLNKSPKMANGLNVAHKLCRVVNAKAVEMRSMQVDTESNVDLQQKNDGSLAQTARRFVEFIQKSSKQEVDLNMMALKIQCPKRRLYDITNVLEGIGLLEKVSKNKVQWTSKDINFSHVAVSSMRTELNDLEKRETELDDAIKMLQSLYEREIEDCINNRFGYVTSDAVKELDLGTNRLLIFANGPKSTELAVYSPEKVAIRSHSGPIEVCITSTDDAAPTESSSYATSASTMQYHSEAEKLLDRNFLAELARKMEEYSNSSETGSVTSTRPCSSTGSMPRSGCGSNRISPIDDVSRDSGLDSPSMAGANVGRLPATPVLPFTPVQHYSLNGKDSWTAAVSGGGIPNVVEDYNSRRYCFTPVQNSLLAVCKTSTEDQRNSIIGTPPHTVIPLPKVPRLAVDSSSADTRSNLTPIVLKQKPIGTSIECSFTPIKTEVHKRLDEASTCRVETTEGCKDGPVYLFQ